MSLTLKVLHYRIVFFHPLKVVSRYRDPQLQVGKKNYIMRNLNPNTSFFLQN